MLLAGLCAEEEEGQGTSWLPSFHFQPGQGQKLPFPMAPREEWPEPGPAHGVMLTWPVCVPSWTPRGIGLMPLPEVRGVGGSMCLWEGEGFSRRRWDTARGHHTTAQQPLLLYLASDNGNLEEGGR